MKSLALAVASMLFAATAVFAQDVSFSGHVQDGKAVCYYCPGFEFVLDNTHASLHSSTIALAPFVGSYVTGTGHWNGSTTTPSIEVTAIQVVPEAFSIGGGGTIGKKMSFNVQAAPGVTAVSVLSFKDGFVPMGTWGTFFLDPLQFFVLGQGVTDSNGQFAIKIDVPNEPALIGLKVFGQAGILGSAGNWTLTNSDLKVLN